MKKTFITILAVTMFVNSYSQKKWDKEIKVTLSDSVLIHEKVNYVLKKWKFKVQNNYNKDTIITKARGIYNPSGYAIIQAIVVGNTVTFSGWYKDLRYGLKEIENTRDVDIKTYKKIVYLKSSSTWRLLNNVAEELKNEELKKELFKNDEINKNEVQSNQPIKSKEVRLRELKDFFEKELITKEEYERAKQKILDEQ